MVGALKKCSILFNENAPNNRLLPKRFVMICE